MTINNKFNLQDLFLRSYLEEFIKEENWNERIIALFCWDCASK